MSKDPAVLFYTSDFLSGTSFLTDEEVGKYIRLLCQQHQIGHIPENHMKIICLSYDSALWSKFVKDGEGKWYNPRMDVEKENRVKYCASRGNNKKGKFKAKSYENHMSLHMEDVNDNGDGPANDLLKPVKAHTTDRFTKGLEFNFEDIWSKYPNRVGKKEALRHFKSSIKTEKDLDDIQTALNNYLKSERVSKGFTQNGSTWFNNWKDWVDVTTATGKSQAMIEMERMIKDDRKSNVSSLSKIS